VTMSSTRTGDTVFPGSFSLSLPADVTAPAVARHSIRVALDRYGVRGQVADDVLLATSELVTNALEHGGEPDRLELACSDARVRLRVFDSGVGTPQLKTPSPQAARSRGLYLVNVLAEDWGFERCESGKYVWAEFLVYPDDQAIG
jgi:anti-sigma regulatory factor (Ser/Thr protein kinase)